MITLNNFSVSPGYFGKLPAYNDFVKFNAAGNEILVFDKWLQDGLIYAKNKLKDNWKSFYDNSMPYKFFYPFTGTDNFILGICFAGIDKSNREFPFLIFFLLSKNIFKNIPVFYFPLIFNEIFISLNDFYLENSHSTDLTELNYKLKNINISVSASAVEIDYRNYLSKTTQEEFWQRTLHDTENHQETLTEYSEVDFINNLLEFRLQMDSSIGFKYNFSSGEDNGVFDLCFFLNLLANSKATSIPAFFWSDKNNSIRLFIFKGKPLPVNFLDLIYTDNINDKILTSVRMSDKNFVYASFKEYLENKKINLEQLLQHFIS